MALDKSQIASLLAGKGKGAGQTYFGEEGWANARLTSKDTGVFVGKQGSVQRNRKGQARIQPNGFRRYHNPVFGDGIQVKAYYAATVVK